MFQLSVEACSFIYWLKVEATKQIQNLHKIYIKFTSLCYNSKCTDGISIGTSIIVKYI